jgi:hypothetical protein
MRINLLLTAAVTAPLFAVVACGGPGHHPTALRGTVTEKKYKPAKTSQKLVPTKSRVCTKKGTKRTCRTVRTGSRYVTVTTRKECYELDIKTYYTGNEVEICDKNAFHVLNVRDHYDSRTNYSKKAGR